MDEVEFRCTYNKLAKRMWIPVDELSLDAVTQKVAQLYSMDPHETLLSFTKTEEKVVTMLHDEHLLEAIELDKENSNGVYLNISTGLNAAEIAVDDCEGDYTVVFAPGKSRSTMEDPSEVDSFPVRRRKPSTSTVTFGPCTQVPLSEDVCEERDLLGTASDKLDGQPLPYTDSIHEDIMCDMCQVFPIKGPRYSCSVCPNHDLCERCENSGCHDPFHPMLKIKVPIPVNIESKKSLTEQVDSYPEGRFFEGVIASLTSEIVSGEQSGSDVDEDIYLRGGKYRTNTRRSPRLLGKVRE